MIEPTGILKNIVSLAATVRTLADKARDRDVRAAADEMERQLRGLEGMVSDLQRQLGTTQRELDDLRVRKAMELREGVLWAPADPVPICRHCFETDDRVMHLEPMFRRIAPTKWRGPHVWHCTRCDRNAFLSLEPPALPGPTVAD